MQTQRTIQTTHNSKQAVSFWSHTIEVRKNAWFSHFVLSGVYSFKQIQGFLYGIERQYKNRKFECSWILWKCYNTPLLERGNVKNITLDKGIAQVSQQISLGAFAVCQNGSIEVFDLKVPRCVRLIGE